jgi:hypothetical protein
MSRKWRLQAQLLGGAANGITIELETLADRICIYRNAGAPVVVEGDPDSSTRPGHSLLGIYDLVGPVGPEIPVYVAVGS